MSLFDDDDGSDADDLFAPSQTLYSHASTAKVGNSSLKTTADLFGDDIEDNDADALFGISTGAKLSGLKQPPVSVSLVHEEAADETVAQAVPPPPDDDASKLVVEARQDVRAQTLDAAEAAVYQAVASGPKAGWEAEAAAEEADREAEAAAEEADTLDQLMGMPSAPSEPTNASPTDDKPVQSPTKDKTGQEENAAGKGQEEATLRGGAASSQHTVALSESAKELFGEADDDAALFGGPAGAESAVGGGDSVEAGRAAQKAVAAPLAGALSSDVDEENLFGPAASSHPVVSSEEQAEAESKSRLADRTGREAGARDAEAAGSTLPAPPSHLADSAGSLFADEDEDDELFGPTAAAGKQQHSIPSSPVRGGGEVGGGTVDRETRQPDETTKGNMSPEAPHHHRTLSSPYQLGTRTPSGIVQHGLAGRGSEQTKETTTDVDLAGEERQEATAPTARAQGQGHREQDDLFGEEQDDNLFGKQGNKRAVQTAAQGTQRAEKSVRNQQDSVGREEREKGKEAEDSTGVDEAPSPGIEIRPASDGSVEAQDASQEQPSSSSGSCSEQEAAMRRSAEGLFGQEDNHDALFGNPAKKRGHGQEEKAELVGDNRHDEDLFGDGQDEVLGESSSVMHAGQQQGAERQQQQQRQAAARSPSDALFSDEDQEDLFSLPQVKAGQGQGQEAREEEAATRCGAAAGSQEDEEDDLFGKDDEELFGERPQQDRAQSEHQAGERPVQHAGAGAPGARATEEAQLEPTQAQLESPTDLEQAQLELPTGREDATDPAAQFEAEGECAKTGQQGPSPVTTDMNAEPTSQRALGSSPDQQEDDLFGAGEQEDLFDARKASSRPPSKAAYPSKRTASESAPPAKLPQPTAAPEQEAAGEEDLFGGGEEDDDLFDAPKASSRAASKPASQAASPAKSSQEKSPAPEPAVSAVAPEQQEDELFGRGEQDDLFDTAPKTCSRAASKQASTAPFPSKLPQPTREAAAEISAPPEADDDLFGDGLEDDDLFGDVPAPTSSSRPASRPVSKLASPAKPQQAQEPVQAPVAVMQRARSAPAEDPNEHPNGAGEEKEEERDLFGDEQGGEEAGARSEPDQECSKDVQEQGALAAPDLFSGDDEELFDRPASPAKAREVSTRSEARKDLFSSDSDDEQQQQHDTVKRRKEEQEMRKQQQKQRAQRELERKIREEQGRLAAKLVVKKEVDIFEDPKDLFESHDIDPADLFAAKKAACVQDPDIFVSSDDEDLAGLSEKAIEQDRVAPARAGADSDSERVPPGRLRERVAAPDLFETEDNSQQSSILEGMEELQRDLERSHTQSEKQSADEDETILRLDSSISEDHGREGGSFDPSPCFLFLSEPFPALDQLAVPISSTPSAPPDPSPVDADMKAEPTSQHALAACPEQQEDHLFGAGEEEDLFDAPTASLAENTTESAVGTTADAHGGLQEQAREGREQAGKFADQNGRERDLQEAERTSAEAQEDNDMPGLEDDHNEEILWNENEQPHTLLRQAQQECEAQGSEEQPQQECQAPRSIAQQAKQEWEAQRSLAQQAKQECEVQRSLAQKVQQECEALRSLAQKAQQECKAQRSIAQKAEQECKALRSIVQQSKQECEAQRSIAQQAKQECEAHRSLTLKAQQECKAQSSIICMLQARVAQLEATVLSSSHTPPNLSPTNQPDPSAAVGARVAAWTAAIAASDQTATADALVGVAGTSSPAKENMSSPQRRRAGKKLGSRVAALTALTEANTPTAAPTDTTTTPTASKKVGSRVAALTAAMAEITPATTTIAALANTAATATTPTAGKKGRTGSRISSLTAALNATAGPALSGKLHTPEKIKINATMLSIPMHTPENVKAKAPISPADQDMEAAGGRALTHLKRAIFAKSERRPASRGPHRLGRNHCKALDCRKVFGHVRPPLHFHDFLLLLHLAPCGQQLTEAQVALETRSRRHTQNRKGTEHICSNSSAT
eukprot:g32134.t1